MAFVGEYVDPATYEEVCAVQIKKFGKPYIPTQWAVDIEIKAFLADYDFDREKRVWSYVFWWRGSYFIFGVEPNERVSATDGRQSGRICSFIAPIHLPPQMIDHAEEVRVKVEEGLVAYESFPLGPAKLIFQNWETV